MAVGLVGKFFKINLLWVFQGGNFYAWTNIVQRVVIRTDSSHIIGIGHVMRCLTLASALTQQLRVKVLFICREFEGNLIHYIQASGFDVHILPNRTKERATKVMNDYQGWLGTSVECDSRETIAAVEIFGKHEVVDLLIVDHYAIDITWESSLRTRVKMILVIDDLANREHDCDILIDQTLCRTVGEYLGLVPETTLLLTGSQYGLLRTQFRLNSDDILKKRREQKSLNRILLMLGGTDPENLTWNILRSLQRIEDLEITVVMGQTAQHKLQIRAFCVNQPSITYLCAVDNVASLMLENDIAIGASGTTTWERCACGLPSLVVVQAQNQEKTITEMVSLGAAQRLTDIKSYTEIRDKLNQWRHSPDLYVQCVKKTLEICDGHGVERLVAAVVDRFQAMEVKIL
ncbi:MAG: UDP-2,4-diacetamido-2,4,6-trideoxy-beta-L-altropyranose hydrolase [Legionellaceae bacterium]|nr:UDP-2,4-diacetamido-2,4,6-trideoxy-beta-L-altropyranose hydrolase [Legionellaceae bacterium]